MVTRLVGSGVQRLGSLVFQKVIRIARIDSALKGASAKSAAVQTAINDFETVIGSRYGQLDQKLNDFLREIERSGIINSMVDNALIGRDSNEVRRIFVDLHIKFMGKDSGAPDLLFDKMMISFRVTLDEITKDKVLLDAFRLYRRELDNAMAGDAPLWTDVSRCAQGCIERREFIREVIAKRLAGEFRRNQIDRCRVIQAAASQFDMHYFHRGAEPEQLSVELSARVRDELKTFILERAQRDALCATIAWQWYGTFDRTLVTKHGVHAYFNERWPHYSELDGLSTIAIAASNKFHLEVPEHVRKRARDFIALIGVVGFLSAPFNRTAFQLKRREENINLGIWEDLLLEEKNPAEMTLGLLFVMMLCTELAKQVKEEDIRSRRRQEPAKVVERVKIISKVLAKKELRELSVFPSVLSAVQAETLFK